MPFLQQDLLAYGHPSGLQVTVMDGDSISPANCARQPYSWGEVGLNKAIVLVNRLNIFWGLEWEAVAENLTESYRIRQTDIIIGCVDTRAARAVIQRLTSHESMVHYVLDCGNGPASGQFILGEPLNAVNRRSRARLRTVSELFPEITDASLDNDGQPSCSAVGAIERQEPFLNSLLANQALALLARLFRYGTLNYHGCFLSLASGVSTAMPIDPSRWKQIMRRNGYGAKRSGPVTSLRS